MLKPQCHIGGKGDALVRTTMENLDEIIENIEKEIRETPYHKGTERHIARLKSRLVRIQEEKIQKIVKASGGGGVGFAVKHTGDATVALVGPPSVGKSSLLNCLTNAESRVGAYDFTTLNVVPGMMKYQGAYIQLLDIPGIVEGAASGKGRGKEVLSIARNADLLLLIVDTKRINMVDDIKYELEKNGIRLDKTPPKVLIIKAHSGGIKINTNSRLDISLDTIKDLASDFRLTNAEIIIKENVSPDELIDVFIGNRVYIPYLVVVNKADLSKKRNIDKDYIYTSTQTNNGLDELKERIWGKLEYIRVYTVKYNKKDDNKPLIVKKGTTLKEIIELLRLDPELNLTKAKISGNGAKYKGQEVSLRFVPVDGTVVEFC